MEKNYRYIYREQRSLINAEAHLRQYLDHRNIYGSTHTYAFLFVIHGMAEELHRDRDNKKWYEQGKKLLDKKFFLKLLRGGKNLRDEVRAYVTYIRKTQLDQITDNDLIDIFLKGQDFYSRLRAYFKTSRPEFQSAVEMELRKSLAQKINAPREQQKAFEIFTTNSDFDEVNQELIEWVQLLSTPAPKSKIMSHILAYPWLVSHSYGDYKILRLFEKKYHQDKKRITHLKQDLRKLKLLKRSVARQQRVLQKTLQDKNISHLAWLFRESAKERIRLKGWWASSEFLYFPLYQEIAQRTEVAIKDICSYYRITEVVQAIKKHKPTVTAAEIRRRDIAYILWLKNNRIEFYSGKRAKNSIQRELKEMGKKHTKYGLTGHIASSGIARGRVRIVLSGDLAMLQKTFREFVKGDIMITTMTQPNMVPLMKKAAGIVADEGGLISHAAIIAREFSIPCLVGTEIGTKVFHNGDFVEVDAYRGIVKKV